MKRLVWFALLGSMVLSGCNRYCDGEDPIDWGERAIDLRVTPGTVIAGRAATFDVSGSKIGGSEGIACLPEGHNRDVQMTGAVAFPTDGVVKQLTGNRCDIRGASPDPSRLTHTFRPGAPGTERLERVVVELTATADNKEGAGSSADASRTFTVRVVTPAPPAPPRAPQSPTASFTYTPEIPLNIQDVTFDASGSSDPDGTIVRYQWDFGSAAANPPTHCCGSTATTRYSSGGTYRVTLTVTDNSGLTATTTRQVTVIGYPSFSAPPPGAAAAARTAAARRLWPVRVRLGADVVRAGSLTVGAFGIRREGVVLRGRMRGRISRRARVPKALRDFYRSDFRGRFSFDRVTAGDALVGSGVAVARSRRDPRLVVCMRLRGDGRRGQLRRNRFTVIGGRGRGARLRAHGTFPLPRRGRTAGRFSVAARSGKRRAMNAECRALLRQMPRPPRRSR